MDRMACVELPELPLQLLLKRHPDWSGRPVAVVDRDKPQGVILEVNEQARAARIRTGMRYSAGLSLAHVLHAGEVPPADVERGVAAVAERLHRFSPDVEPSHDEPGVFWLNASGLSHLHASLHGWAQEIVASLRAGGFRASVAVGFTRFGTYAIARTIPLGEAAGAAEAAGAIIPGEAAGATEAAGAIIPGEVAGVAGTARTITPGAAAIEAAGTAETVASGGTVVVIRDLAGERMLAGRTPLNRIGIDPALRDSLHKLGIRTVRAFLRLPSEGVRRRFGPEARRLHRLAAGDLWAPLQPQRVTAPLVALCDLDDPEGDAVRLLFYVKRLLDRLLATAAVRHEALAELTLRLRLDRAGAHTERIRPAAPTVDIVQLMNLVRLRLETLALGAGVTELRVTGRAVRTEAMQQGLFAERPRRDRAAAERALARVRAEFGDAVVVRARLVEAHLPEAQFIWEPAETMPHSEPREVACRPMVRRIHARLLALPPGLEPRPEPAGRPVRDDESGCVRELAGPYLVSGGWWRSAVHREYHFVQTSDGDMLWVYYDRPRQQWRWQGRVE